MSNDNPARNTRVMNRFDLTSRLIAKLKNEEAVIGGIGNTNFDLWAAGHRPQNFYMLGSMGLAFPIALGVALAQPDRRIFALEGDGSLLMQLGSLSTIATLAPKNLTMVVMDNGIYQITGAQPTPGAAVADIVAIAVASGLTSSSWAADEDDFWSLDCESDTHWVVTSLAPAALRASITWRISFAFAASAAFAVVPRVSTPKETTAVVVLPLPTVWATVPALLLKFPSPA